MRYLEKYPETSCCLAFGVDARDIHLIFKFMISERQCQLMCIETNS